MTESDDDRFAQQREFVREGKKSRRLSFWSDYYFFLKTTRKWWMLPLLLLLLAYGLVLILGTTGAAPYIYTLF